MTGEVIVCSLILALFCWSICACGEAVERQSREISCRCGANATRIIGIDEADRTEMISLLSDECRRCRYRERIGRRDGFAAGDGRQSVAFRSPRSQEPIDAVG